MKKIIIILAVCACVAAAGYSAYKFYKASHHPLIKKTTPAKKTFIPKNKEELAKRTAAWKSLKGKLAAEMKGFNGIVGLVIKDLDMNWEINSSKDKIIPSASLVKIPIMLAYYDSGREHKIDLSTKIELKNSLKTSGSGILKNAVPGQAFSLEDYIIIMVTESDNTASNILIDFMGFDELNSRFKKLGLKKTDIVRRMMDFKARKKGIENYTTTGEMAYLLEQIYRGKAVSPDVSKKCLSILVNQKVNDRIPKELPKGTVTAHKTGLEDGICHDVGIVYTPKGPFLICVLTKHNYKYAVTSKKMIARMSLLTYKYFEGL